MSGTVLIGSSLWATAHVKTQHLLMGHPDPARIGLAMKHTDVDQIN